MHAIRTPPRIPLLAVMTLMFLVLVMAAAPAGDLPNLDLSFGGTETSEAPVAPDAAPAGPVVSDGFDLTDPIAPPIETLK